MFSNSLAFYKREAGCSINSSIGLRLPRDVPGCPACEPAAQCCSACAASNTAAPPTSVRWPLSPPPRRDGTSTVDSPVVILRHNVRPPAPLLPARSAPSSCLVYLRLLVVVDLRCYSPGDSARGNSPPVCCVGSVLPARSSARTARP